MADARSIEGPVVIVGLGLMGGSLARVLRNLDVRGGIGGVDPDPLTGARALDDGTIDRFDPEGDALISDAGIVVYAAPLGVTRTLLRDHAAQIGPDAVVTDVVSLKAPIMDRAAEVGLADRMVGAHPLCGSEASGYGAAREGLYEEARVFLCAAGATGAARERVEAFWRALGTDPEFIDAGEHDRRMAWVSHLPQLVSNALAGALHAAGFGPEDLGPGAKDMTRLAASSPQMWEELLAASAPLTGTGLTSVTRALQVIGDLLARRDVDRIAEFMQRTREWKAGEGSGAPGVRDAESVGEGTA